MAIKITLYYPKKGEKHKDGVPLEDNGVYWFLYPFFTHIYERTGEMIDLYGTARFAGDALSELDRALEDLMEAVIAQPDVWDQKVGTLIKPEKRTLYDRTAKSDVLKTINSIKSMTSEGIRNNAVIVFEGL